MIDITSKFSTMRAATAEATLSVHPTTIALIHSGGVPKGDPLPVAKVAAIMAAKSTSQLIPYCHPLTVEYVGVNYTFEESYITITVQVKAVHKTGVEMEALAAATIAALTLYDMLKAVDKGMEIVKIRLCEKSGGMSDLREKRSHSRKAAVLVMSDSIARGDKDDLSGTIIVQRLEEEGFTVVEYQVITDDIEEIVDRLRYYSDELQLDLVLTTGGTGIGPRDHTPEAMQQVIERHIPGISEALRAYGQARHPYAMLSRADAGVRANTLLINLPGSPQGVLDALNTLFPAISHAFAMIGGEGHVHNRTLDVNRLAN